MKDKRKNIINVGLIDEFTEITDVLKNSKEDEKIYETEKWGYIIREIDVSLKQNIKDKFKTSILEKEIFVGYKNTNILIYKKIKNNRYIVMNIGDIRSQIQPNNLEMYFGFKTFLNYFYKENIDFKIKETISKNLTNNDVILYRKGKETNNIKLFLFNNKIDILNKISFVFPSKNKKKEETIKIGHWFPYKTNFEGKEALDSAVKFVEKYYYLETYKEHGDWKFLDNFHKPTWDKIKFLEEKLDNKIMENDGKFNAQIDWPDLEPNNCYFKIMYNKMELCSTTFLNLNKILKICKEKQIRPYKCHIKLFDGNEQKVISQYKLKNCLFFEYDEGDDKYILLEGKWFLINRNYQKEVEKDYKNLSNSNLHDNSNFPLWDGKLYKKEEEFLEYVAKKLNLINFDQEFVYFTQYNKLEIADLCNFKLGDYKNNQLFFVKKGYKSYDISHLKQQVINSTRAIVLNAAKINEKLKSNKNLSLDENFKIEDCKNIIIAIATDKSYNLNSKLPKITFFAQATITEFFGEYTKIMSDYNFKIMWIEHQI